MSDNILPLSDKWITMDNSSQIFIIPELYLVPFTPSTTLRAHGSSTMVYPKYGVIIRLKNIAYHFLSARVLY
jgi:predicted metallopeptidase